MVLSIIYCVLAGIFGIMFCFFGYKYLRKLLFVLGFLIGALVTYIIVAPLMTTLLAILVSVAAGVVVGLLMFFLYVLGIFVTGACFGGGLALVVCGLCGWSVAYVGVIVAMCVAAILFGVLAVIFRRALMIISTSFTGASAIVMYLGYVVFGFSRSVTLSTLTGAVESFYAAHSTWMIIATLAFTVAGCLIQFFTAPKTAKRKKA